MKRNSDQFSVPNPKRSDNKVRHRSDGIYEEGTFVDGHLKHGHMRMPSGMTYYGTFNAGQFENGSILGPDGSIRDGHFENGLLKRGRYTGKDELLLAGEFENETLIDGITVENDFTMTKGHWQGENFTGARIFDSQVDVGYFDKDGLIEGGNIKHSMTGFSAEIGKYRPKDGCFEEGTRVEEDGSVEAGIFDTHGEIQSGVRLSDESLYISRRFFPETEDQRMYMGVKIVNPQKIYPEIQAGFFNEENSVSQGVKVRLSGDVIERGEFRENKLQKGVRITIDTVYRGTWNEGKFVGSMMNLETGEITVVNESDSEESSTE